MTRSQLGPLGLDKLRFYGSASQVVFRPDAPLIVQPASVASDTGEQGREMTLWRDTSGAPYVGAKAYLNAGDYVLEVLPDWETGSAFCSVTFSAGAFSESNLKPLAWAETRAVTFQVMQDLKARGVSLDLWEWKLTRLDVAFNAPLSERFMNYSPLFGAVGGRKTDKVTDFGPTGFRVGNTQYQLVIYDKGAQMRELGYLPALCPDKVARAELRFSNAAKIKAQLGLADSSLSELGESWGAIAPAYQKHLRQKVFSMAPETLKPALDLEALAKTCSAERFPFEAFLKLAGLSALIHQVGEAGAVDFYETFFAPSLSDKSRAKARKVIKQAAFTLATSGRSASGRELVALYRELEEELLAV